MRPLTRRDALHGAVALLAGLAGCSGSGSSSSSSVGTTPTAAVRDGPRDSGPTPEHYSLRGGRDGWVVRLPDESAGGTDGRAEDRWRHELVASTETAESLTLADVDGADRARAFLAETDFETETVYLEERVVGECWELDLCSVHWASDHVETDYGRRLRPVDAACSADAKVAVATLIRIPEPLDPDRVTQFSSGSGGRCRVTAGQAGGEVTESEAGTATATATTATDDREANR